jgi:hypothetical protein
MGRIKMRYAKIENGKVENVIVLLDEDLPKMPSDWTLIKSETANIGDDYINGVFVAQAPAYVEPPAITEKFITAIAFKLRFTAPERVAIYASTDAMVKDFVSLLDDPRLTQVDLMLPTTIQAVEYLQQAGLLTAERKDEILA